MVCQRHSQRHTQIAAVLVANPLVDRPPYQSTFCPFVQNGTSTVADAWQWRLATTAALQRRFERSRCCDTSIFRPGNVMQLQRGRVAQMVRDATRLDSCISCHETLGGDEFVCVESSSTCTLPRHYKSASGWGSWYAEVVAPETCLPKRTTPSQFPVTRLSRSRRAGTAFT